MEGNEEAEAKPKQVMAKLKQTSQKIPSINISSWIFVELQFKQVAVSLHVFVICSKPTMADFAQCIYSPNIYTILKEQRSTLFGAMTISIPLENGLTSCLRKFRVAYQDWLTIEGLQSLATTQTYQRVHCINLVQYEHLSPYTFRLQSGF